MKKEQKKQAEGSIGLLERIHTELKRVLDGKNKVAALELLTQCQSTAITLGEMIEDIEGQGGVTVSLVEQYCEQVYQIYEEVRQRPAAVIGNKAHNRLARQLIRIRNSIREDIPTRIEVVFLPYKASMWDSLESIWRAADADPDCDAYVVPIPYYDRNPDGSLGQMHYEGDQYPEDVPIADYRTYDLSARHPDMVFIHNPYDNNNLVTSVHPDYHAKNLKPFTEKLVYVPYFILGEVDPEDERALEGIEHFCTAPGVIYADQVIVQSEEMRRAYINILTKSFGEKTRRYWEKKILGLGSPKIDKILEAEREEQKLPESWERIVRKPDGSRKKVIFYNNSIASLLQYEEKMLQKLRDVLRTFKENEREVALLWRPHPLLQAATAPVKPQIWEGYRAIVDRYRKEGWGIFDDTPELDRAIAVSDAYYGDGSSVVQLFREVGKPAMIQNVEV